MAAPAAASSRAVRVLQIPTQVSGEVIEIASNELPAKPSEIVRRGSRCRALWRGGL
jgi:hypothetical protein